MALFFDPTPANVKQQIAQIDFILNNPLKPVCKLFLSYWTEAELRSHRERLKIALTNGQPAINFYHEILPA